MKILLMGPPASGKGTVGEELSKKLGLPLVSVGGLLRHVPETHPRYNELHNYMNAGELVPQDFVAPLLKERLNEKDCANGYILDGWMRSLKDREHFEPDLDKVIFINISSETSIKRISGRRVCEVDEFICNIYTMSEEDSHNCKTCSGELIQREDDKKEIVENRLKVYAQETLPVLEYFKTKGNLVEIDGKGTPAEVFALVEAIL